MKKRIRSELDNAVQSFNRKIDRAQKELLKKGLDVNILPNKVKVSEIKNNVVKAEVGKEVFTVKVPASKSDIKNKINSLKRATFENLTKPVYNEGNFEVATAYSAKEFAIKASLANRYIKQDAQKKSPTSVLYIAPERLKKVNVKTKVSPEAFKLREVAAGRRATTMFKKVGDAQYVVNYKKSYVLEYGKNTELDDEIFALIDRIDPSDFIKFIEGDNITKYHISIDFVYDDVQKNIIKGKIKSELEGFLNGTIVL